MRTRIRNQLRALAMNENRCLKGKLWSEQGRAELEKLPLALWASRRRRELLQLLDRLDPTIEELTAAAAQEAKKRPEAFQAEPGRIPPLPELSLIALAPLSTSIDRRKHWVLV
jgi:transposase